MKLVNKKKIVKVFSVYVAALIFAGILINAFTGVNVLKKSVDLTKNGTEKTLGLLNIFKDGDLNEIAHPDVTGLKFITRNRRMPAEIDMNSPVPVYASNYNVQTPAVPVEYQGVLTDQIRADIRAKITDVAKRYIGRPYVYAGKGPNSFDCSGYTSFILKQFGIKLSAGSRHQANQGKPVSLASTKVGDLLFFSAYGRGGVITHVGLVIDNNSDGITVIHANGPRHGIMVENVSKSSYWKNKILFARDVISSTSSPSI